MAASNNHVTNETTRRSMSHRLGLSFLMWSSRFR